MRSKRVIYNIVTNIILQLISIIYGFIVPKIIISEFGSDVNGLVSSITQFLAYITLLESGFGPVIKATLYKPIAKKDSKAIADILRTSERFFRRIAWVFVLYIVILFFVYPFIVDKTFNPAFTIAMIAIMGLSKFAEYFFGMTYRLYLQAEQKLYITSIIQAIAYIANALLIVFMAMAGSDILLIELISGLIFMLRPILQNIYVKKKYKINLASASPNYRIKHKWDGLAQHIAATIHENTDITILTLFRSLSEVSVYSVYYLVITGIRRLIRSFSDGIDSLFGDMIANDESENLNKVFSPYETVYALISTIIFSCTIVLIVPFIAIFTQNVTDADYIRPIFGTLLVVSEYVWAIRQPYNLLIKASGHFKETRKGAWVESVINILVSVVLVNQLGIIGVAIGTVTAMSVRTIEFVYHANKHILHRSIWESARRIIIAAIETAIIVWACNYLPYLENTNYINWALNAMEVVIASTAISLVASVVIFRKDFREMKTFLKNITKRKKND
ncbi:polysaccharide biosynthesis C-terminal domain-containing protein [Candidatus Saccharibacteria bacterium]|nr:polysaccharide biosynthesis C-terminal domain-containing protein [Candidatus Saccharibacteria bacterium]